jgi:predicted ATPase
MRITKINIPKTPENNDGLDDIVMNKLGPIVLIAGKNGSGKTRILNKIISTLHSKPTLSQYSNAKAQTDNLYSNIFEYEQQIKNNEAQLMNVDEQLKDNIKLNIVRFQNMIEDANRAIKYHENILKWPLVETTEYAEMYQPIPFVPKSLQLQNSDQYSLDNMINAANNIDTIGVQYLPNGAFAKIQIIQNKWREATHQDNIVPLEVKQKAIDDYNRLNNLIETFLGTSIGRTIDSKPTLFGFPMNNSNLSDGQIILLQFCLAIYSQETSLKDLILILDEPENHLHSSVLIETLDRIRECNSNGQIWIATHSIPLLAHFDPSLIWFVENNKIRHAGKIPEKVLHGLLGDDEEVGKLQDFISLPAQYATINFTSECLMKPQTVMTDSSDPQSTQVRSELIKLTASGKYRVLDYGAGQGRLISNIYDLDKDDSTKLIEKMEYIAFDKYDQDKEICENSLVKAFGISDNKYFNDFDKLISVYDKESFKCVIMCNVLHEIDPKDWLKLFAKDGEITSLLSDDGVLLLIEDYQIPVGEKAYQKGFLVLDSPHLKELFKIKEDDKDFGWADKYGDGRLKAHLIPKKCLIRIDENSRIKSLESLSVTARNKIFDIRGKEQNYQNGKLHGFWTQQFANAELNLSELRTK